MAKWITKANDDVLSFCACAHPLAALPGQLDCPWCGCGYLMTCTFCRKAFTFGRIITIDHTAESLIRADRSRGGYEADEDDTAMDAIAIRSMLEPFAEGEEVFYLDGAFHRVGERDIRFDGLFAAHDLLVSPQELARAGLVALTETVGRADYWIDRRLEVD